MKYVYGLIAFTFIVVFSFCSGEKETIKEQTKVVSVAKCLNEANLFQSDSVTNASELASELQKTESRKYFLQALDLLVNKKNAQGSIEFFKESIYYYPNDKGYYFLTKAYIETADIVNARQANEISMRLGYDPYYETIYLSSVISAMQKDTATCLENLDGAIMEGFLNKDRILQEKAFDFMRDDPRYTAMMVNTFNDDSKLKALLFKNYMKLFPDLTLPYTEPKDSASKYNYDKYINYDYAAFIPGMEDGRFSRDVTNEYLFVGKMSLDNKHFAVVYKVVMAIADTLNPVKTYVMTYDSLGTIIDNEMIGCFCSPTSSKAFTIEKDYTISSTDYISNWLNDPLEKGYAGNKITSTEQGDVTQVQVNTNGTLKRADVAKNSGVEKTKTGG